jgi:Ala-tRNA(Pro) deacylase
MGEHPISQQIIDLLTEHNFWYEAFEHEPVRTSEEAASVRPGYSLGQGAKALIVRAKVSGEGKKFIMLVMPADQKFDSGKAKSVLRSKDVRFATEEEVESLTGGVKPGGVPPFGNLFGLQVVTDPALYTHEKIIFNAGRNCSIAVKSMDYKLLVSPLIAEII